MTKAKDTEILVNDTTIRREKNKLLKIFKPYIKEADENGKMHFTDKGAVLEGLIDEAAFVRAVLFEAKRLIKEGGIETTTINGSQKYKNATPATKIYSEYLRAYTPLVDTLLKYIPDKQQKKQSRLEAMMFE